MQKKPVKQPAPVVTVLPHRHLNRADSGVSTYVRTNLDYSTSMFRSVTLARQLELMETP
jgi:hypothetical protein